MLLLVYGCCASCLTGKLVCVSHWALLQTQVIEGENTFSLFVTDSPSALYETVIFEVPATEAELSSQHSGGHSALLCPVFIPFNLIPLYCDHLDKLFSICSVSSSSAWTKFHHTSALSLPGQLTSARLMSCWRDADSSLSLIYSDRRQVSRRAVLEEQKEAAFSLELPWKWTQERERDEDWIYDRSRLWYLQPHGVCCKLFHFQDPV